MKFTKTYREKVRELGKTKDAALETLKEYKEKDILKDYIIEHESEVIDIMMALYDKDSYMKLFEKQKEKEGGIKMLASLVKDGVLTIPEAARRAELPVEEFKIEAGLAVVH